MCLVELFYWIGDCERVSSVGVWLKTIFEKIVFYKIVFVRLRD